MADAFCSGVLEEVFLLLSVFLHVPHNLFPSCCPRREEPGGFSRGTDSTHGSTLIFCSFSPLHICSHQDDSQLTVSSSGNISVLDDDYDTSLASVPDQ